MCGVLLQYLDDTTLLGSCIVNSNILVVGLKDNKLQLDVSAMWLGTTSLDARNLSCLG